MPQSPTIPIETPIKIVGGPFDAKRLDQLREINELSFTRELNASELKSQRELLAKIGAPGRLLRSQVVEEVLPLEDKEALQKQVAEGKLTPDQESDARRKAMVKNLPTSGLAVIVLGGSHDLGPHLPAGTLYVRVTPKSYPQ